MRKQMSGQMSEEDKDLLLQRFADISLQLKQANAQLEEANRN